MAVQEGQAGSESLTLSDESRVLALDWGTKRVGLAVSDPFGMTAQGLPTMSRRNKQQDLNYLRLRARKHHVSLILLGNPLQMSGAEGTAALRMRDLAKEIEQHVSLHVRLWDERLTSVEANRLLDAAGVIPSRRGESVDRVAAVLLLQNFLDSQPRKAAFSENDTGDDE